MYIIQQAPAAAPITISSSAATVAFSVIAGEPGAGTQCNLNMPGSNKLNGQPFTVRACGNVVAAAGTYTTAAIAFVLYAGNTASFAAAIGNGIFSSTAIGALTYSSAVATTIDWEIEAQLQGNNTAAKLTGRGNAYTNNPNNGQVFTAIGGLAVIPTSVNFAAEPPAQFTVGLVTAATPNYSTANLTSFVLEA